jgi:hypothetical protein
VPISFRTRTQAEAYAEVRDWLEDLAADVERELTFVSYADAPMFGVTVGSAYVEVELAPHNWQYVDGEDEDALVIIRAILVVQANVNDECLRYLLRKNDEFVIGAFSLGVQDEIVFSHALPFSYCDSSEELETYLALVCETADEQDDIIIDRWGGITPSY